MTNKITTAMLLEHIQAMKQDLLLQMKEMRRDLQGQISDFRKEVHVKFAEVDAKLEDARLHREALQEDLVATIRQAAKHEKKLARL